VYLSEAAANEFVSPECEELLATALECELAAEWDEADPATRPHVWNDKWFN
jgi:hypothetical protein